MDLNKDNFDILVAKHYQGRFWTNEELENDLKRVSYIKRLVGKFLNKRELNERLILNHIIILNNVFGTEMTTKILFFQLEDEYWPVIKTFLSFLNYLPPNGRIDSIEGKIFDIRRIQTDLQVAKVLQCL